MSILKGIQQTSIFDRAKLKQITLGKVPSEEADKSESSKDTEYLRQVEHFTRKSMVTVKVLLKSPQRKS